MGKTLVRGTSKRIEITIPTENTLHDSLIRTLPVRKHISGSSKWLIPWEDSTLLLNIVNQTKAEKWDVDPKIRDYASKLDFVTKTKFYKVEDIPEAFESVLKTDPHQHQLQWLAWADRFKTPANLCEQGTGKSKMALDWLTLKDCNMVLIICRNSNCFKWAEETRKHSDYKPFVLKGLKYVRQEKLRLAKGISNTGRQSLCIINYEYVHSFFKDLAKISWDSIILDESTRIKDPRTKQHKACVKLGQSVKYKLILTGTPLVNSPLDAYGQFKFLNPFVFGQNFQGFKNRYVIFGGFNGYQAIGFRNESELADKIGRFSFRVLKRDCLDLPPKIYQELDLEKGEAFSKGYSKIVKSALLELGDKLVDNNLAIVKLGRCLQYCDGFLYTKTGDNTEYTRHTTPKYKELTEFMQDHFLSSDRMIIWTHFRAAINILYEDLSAKFPHIQFDRIAGGVTEINKQQLINSFNDSSIKHKKNRCLILQSAANCHGIDLRCDTVFYYSRMFSGEIWLQSQDRTHGINRGIEGISSTYIIPRIKGTVEMSVDRALKKKKSISDLILRDGISVANLMRGE